MQKNEKVKCARCRRIIQGRPALSRKDNKSQVCSACGLIEAKEVYQKSMYERSKNNA